MKTVVLRLDRYSKVALTVIAIALILIAIKPFLPTELEASPQVIDVNIARVGGYSTYGTLDVNVTNPNEIGYWVYYYSD
jgi:hypothetical protein